MDENEPVAANEFVYRRIHPKFYKAGSPISILYEAFRPSHSDETGLSVLRAGLAQPHNCLARIDAAAVGEYVVARLAVAALGALGLTVEPDPIADGPPGHAIIPQLNWSDYNADKQRWKPVLLEIAKLASADIVHRPTEA